VKLSMLRYTGGSSVPHVIQDTVQWLDYTYRCVLIRVSPWLLERWKQIQSIHIRNRDISESHDEQRYTRVITHLSRSMDRYIRGPMVHFHKMKFTIFIGLVPLLVAGVSSIACCETLPQKTVRTIPITRANTPSESFEMRWLPVAEIPKRVKTIDVRATTNDAVDTARPSVALDGRNNHLGRQDVAPSVPIVDNVAQVEHDILPRRRPRNIRYLYKRDQRTCVRHNMRTVYYGKRWRCRR